jgi:phospholipid/cholesterol/gamma-HCH transport system substrate-binding protein
MAMAKRMDEVKVGVMVIGAGLILIITVFMMMNQNPFQAPSDQYRVHLNYAGGLEKDNIVRFGGLKRGKVAAVQLTPDGPSAIEIIVSLKKGTPVRTDSVARLASLNALSENYIEISPGNSSSPLLKPGQTIKAEETPEFTALLRKISALSDDAGRLIADLDRDVNQITKGANAVLGNLNEATGPRNRKALTATLEGAHTMITNANDLITRTSPRIEAVAKNLQETTERLPALTERFDEVTARANSLLEHIDGTVTESRPQLKRDLESLESTLTEARKVMADISALLEANRNDIDTIIENVRRSSENLREFTDTLKRQPYSLIRIKEKSDRKVPK